jgi:D-alanyl-D-alanine carboxypeptidase
MKTVFALLIACLVFIPSVLLAQAAPANRYTFGRDFTVEPCPPEAEGFPPHITCGYLSVPENRTNQDSHTIEIAVAIVHTPNPEAQTPLVVLGGGPGGPLIEIVFSAPELAAGLAMQSDVIFVEQRGVGYSRPRLVCDDPIRVFDGDEEAVRACFDKLISEGIDLTGYNSIEAAADVAALRLALGVDEWNILGGSYGTRWALTVARNHPDGVRSLVLDGVFPPQMDFDVWMRAIPGVLDRVLAACASDAACNTTYPDLNMTLRATITRLNDAPLTVIGEAFTGDDLVNWIFNAAYSAEQITLIPAVIGAAANGDIAFLENHTPLPAGTLELASAGMAAYLSVQCNEEIALSNRDAFIAQVNDADPLAAAVARNNLREYTSCAIWQSGQAPAVEDTPVTGDIPTLILNGEFDPATPLADGYLAAETLANATVLDFPGEGHGVIFRECAVTLMHVFLSTLDGASLDTSCIAEDYGAPEFVLPDEETSTMPAIIAELQAQMDEEIAANPSIPGQLLTVIAPTAGVDADLAAGVVDFASGSTLEPGAAFRIASVTKTFTAAAVLRLVEMGEVDLDASIEQYVSAESIAILQADGYATDSITVRQLLLHTSGIADFSTFNPAYFTAVLGDPTHEWTRTEQLQFAVDTTDPIGEPGLQYSYSDTGYILLGELIERRTGQPLGTAVRALLDYERFGLRHTYWETQETPPANAPVAHQYFGETDSTTALSPTIDVYGGGGLVSTTRDLAVFFRALLRGEVFEQAETLDTMLNIPQTNLGAQEGMDAGMGIFRISGGGLTCFTHGGFWGVIALYCPDLDIAIARSINQANQQNVSLLSVVNPALIYLMENAS